MEVSLPIIPSRASALEDGEDLKSIISETFGSIDRIKSGIDQINESSAAVSTAIEEQNATTEQVSGASPADVVARTL